MIATTGLSKPEWASINNTQVWFGYRKTFGIDIPAKTSYGDACKEIVNKLGRPEAFRLISSMRRWF